MNELGMVIAAILAAGALLAPSSSGRAVSMLGALVLTPVLLIADVADTPQLEPLRDRPELTAAGAAVGLLVLAGLAVLLRRRPGLLAVLAFAAIPFRVPVEAGGSTANLLVPLYAVIGAGALAWLVPRLLARETFAPRPNGWLERVLAGAVVLYALQAAYSSDVPKALEQVVFFYVPFALLFVLLRELEWTPRQLARCVGVLVGLALVFVAIGFLEFWQRELLLNPKVIASNQFESYFRVNSLFFDPNIYGRFLALVMLGIAGVLLWSQKRRPVVLAALMLAVLWAGLLLTLSQSSFAALLAGLVVLAALRWGAPWRALGIAGVVIAAAAVLVLAFPSAVRLDLSSSESIDKATSGRFDLMRGGVELALERPVQGFGSASFSREYRRRENTSSERAISASHTIPITVAAEQGVIGLAVYLALLGSALARLLNGAGRFVGRAVVGAGFVALVVHTWLYAAFLEDPVSWALLGVGAALARATMPPSSGSAVSTASERPVAA